MRPGKEMNEWVARHVLGEAGESAPAYSEDLATAWKLVDLICESGFRLQLDGSRLWQARFYKSAAHTLETHAVSTTGRTPAEAICLAALALKGALPPK